MDDLTEDILNNVNHLIECQRFVVERVEFLETKRLEITNMIQSLSDPNHKETLENQLNKMEMKVSITCVTDKVHNRVVVIDDCLDMIKNIKCRYNDRGYCRSQSDCVFFHAENVCDKVLSNGKCTESKKCLLRHPRDCRHWMGDTRGCLRGSSCMYLHIANKKGINIKIKKNYHKTKNESKEPNNGEMTWEKPTTKNVDPLIEIINVKDKEIREKEEALVKLMSENEGITEENNKLKRCAKNMNQEIKHLRSRGN